MTGGAWSTATEEGAEAIHDRLPRRALPIATACFAVLLFSANLATPLYAVYEKRFAFSPLVVTLIFAIYALVLVPSLLAFGQLADQFGRKPMMIAGLAIAMVGLALFAAAQGVWWLIGARICQGIAQGAMSGAATAALTDAYTGPDVRRPALLASLAQAGGAAGGPLVAGCIAQWSFWPTRSPYLLGIVACLLLLVALVVTDIGHAPTRQEAEERHWRIRRPRVPRAIRADFARVAITAAAAWAVAGALFLAVMPAYAASIVGTTNLGVLGAITALMLTSSCVMQIAVRRGAPAALAQGVGLLLLAAGLGGLVAADPTHLPWLLIVSAVVAGCGHGLAALAAQDDLTRIAPDEARAEVSAAFYVCIYLGVSVPAIGIGLVTTLSGSLSTGIHAFALVTGLVAVITAGWHRAHARDAGGYLPSRG